MAPRVKPSESLSSKMHLDGGEAKTIRDDELVRLARGVVQSLLRLGELLDVLYEANAHFQLGFSSFEAYARERCGRSERWCHDARRLARRIRTRGLSKIRSAMRSGQVTWSMTELLVRFATAENEATLLDRARGRTVRETRQFLSQETKDDSDNETTVTTTHTVGAPERMMVEMSRMAVEHIEGRRVGNEAFLTALLGEALSTLHVIGESSDRMNAEIEAPDVNPDCAQALGAGRSASPPPPAPAPDAPPIAPVPVDLAPDLPLPGDALGLDTEIRKCVRDLAERDLRIGELARPMINGGGWRTLGYASREQYAKERLGLSLSSVEHRMTLARRAHALPSLQKALVAGEIGYEAALQIARLPDLGPMTAAAWISRARRRTVVHLREEIRAVLLRRSLDRNSSCAPPDDAVLQEISEIERKVQTGELFGSLLGPHLRGPQMSVTLPAGTGCRLTFSVSAELKAHFDEVEAEFRHLAGPKASFVAFMCVCLWSSWLPWLEAKDSRWKDIFRRDRNRCSNPVCDRSDVTPHHLQFRAHGGGDEDENMVSLCAWCHLEGIHGGRISAEPPASCIRWRVGPLMEVHGRDVVARR